MTVCFKWLFWPDWEGMNIQVQSIPSSSTPPSKVYEKPRLVDTSNLSGAPESRQKVRMPGQVLSWEGLRRLLGDKQSMGTWLGTSSDERFM